MTDDQDFVVPAVNYEVRDRADRLRRAVRAAGGNRAVAARSGVPIGTLGYYIAGRDMKASAMISLAAACNVSLEWLATGREPMAPAAAPAEPAQEPARGAFATLDVHRFADALEVAEKAIAARQTNPDWLRRAQIILLIYDELAPSPPED
jgi:hypothetical protein